ncbi:hypothetical protein HPB50_001966 [Hyalomma asiaticum]|uniref:Uncharacterized protein n=1 Tax=Hyalomma asiaticum TaxID=266040 RepID=A0ACB7RNP9_HYAAI|nr:hypothetical protein HPB50_001966 [Hyalomma asiaticum]
MCLRETDIQEQHPFLHLHHFRESILHRFRTYLLLHYLFQAQVPPLDQGFHLDAVRFHRFVLDHLAQVPPLDQGFHLDAVRFHRFVLDHLFPPPDSSYHEQNLQLAQPLLPLRTCSSCQLVTSALPVIPLRDVE